MTAYYIASSWEGDMRKPLERTASDVEQTHCVDGPCNHKFFPESSREASLKERIHFIYFLRQPRIGGLGQDYFSKTLRNWKWQGNGLIPVFHITLSSRINEEKLIFARNGLRRITWLSAGQGSDNSLAAGNDSRIRARGYGPRRGFSTQLRDKFIPKLVRRISTEPVDNLTVKAPTRTWNQIKERVVITSTGLRLDACESILEFLKVMYDLVETHERVLERGVLHRDINWYNVLYKPQHFVGDAAVVNYPTIGKLLGESCKEPRCLLTGFDNACLLEKKNLRFSTKETGTPMFMACELLYERRGYEVLRVCRVAPITLDQFALNNDIFEAYIKVYGKERYNLCDEWLQSIISSNAEEAHPFDAGETSRVSHQPHHDIESIYWLILWFLVKSCPKCVELEDPSLRISRCKSHNYIIKTMLARGTDADDAFAIVPWLGNSGRIWEIMLHPVYKHLVTMLASMGGYIRMRWSRLPDVPSWHSHEVFKRLLLKQIVQMTNANDPIPIQGHCPLLNPTPFDDSDASDDFDDSGDLDDSDSTLKS